MFYVLGNRVQHTLAALGKQEENRNIEIQAGNHGREAPGIFRASGRQPLPWDYFRVAVYREFEPVCGALAPLALRRRSSAFLSIICSISWPVFCSVFEKALQLLY
jgi:hypothetical protein